MIPLNLTNILGYCLIIAALLYGAYTMVVIKQEQTHFKDDSKSFNLLYYRLFVPYWWTAVKTEKTLIEFARTDTRYDWYGKFFFQANESENLEQILESFLEQKQIILDDDKRITHTKHGLIKSELKNHIKNFYRVEGTGTEAETERIYYDICLIQDKRHKEILFCESRASVLNGGVEGPFFEEVLKYLEDSSLA